MIDRAFIVAWVLAGGWAWLMLYLLQGSLPDGRVPVLIFSFLPAFVVSALSFILRGRLL